MMGVAIEHASLVAVIEACEDFRNRVATTKAASGHIGSYEPEGLKLAARARELGRSDLAIAALTPFVEKGSSNAQLHFLLALALRDEQFQEAAVSMMEKAVHLEPRNDMLVFAKAQFSFENWQPAARLFRDAQRMAPQNLEITKNAAAALSAEGKSDTAIKILAKAIHGNPGWIEGHQQIAKYKILSGNRTTFDISFKEACNKLPGNLQLRLAWFHLLVQARDWEAARAVIQEGEKKLGEHRAFKVANALIAAETGDNERASELFTELSSFNDSGFDLCKVRFYLRTDQADRAEHIASQHIGKTSVRSFWPYLSIAWRLMGDARAEWLDRHNAFITAFDLPIDLED